MVLVSIILTTVSGMKNLCNLKKNETLCEVEYGSYLTNQTKRNSSYLNILEYNIDKNGYEDSFEKGYKAQMDQIQKFNEKQPLDVIVLIEVSRDCQKEGNYINYADELSKLLHWNYIYTVEYVLFSNDNERQCTSGNAILSAFPMTNYGSQFFKHQGYSYHYQKAGGRSFGFADIKVEQANVTKQFHLVTTHLESGTFKVIDIIGS